MKTLEDLVSVPPLKLCLQIPAGDFAHSALVWRVDYDGELGVWARWVTPSCKILAPAPTLHEILQAFGSSGLVEVRDHTAPAGGWWCSVWCKDRLLRSRNDINSPTAAALKLWLRVYGKGEAND